MLGCPRPPNKSVLLEKFWNVIDFNRFGLIGVDREKHIPDKRWLLDVLATYTPEDEIFRKSYNPLKEPPSYLKSKLLRSLWTL